VFDDVWVEIHRDLARGGVIRRFVVCDKGGQRIDLPITKYIVEQGPQDPGTAQIHVLHGRVEYIDL
jgi:hypothetical protein